MSDLGRRSRRVYNPNSDYINNIIQTGISQKILPDNFRSIIGNNTRPDLFKNAYDDAIENGFVFAKKGEPDTDFFAKYWEQTQNQIRDTHTAIWRTPAYQEIEGKARVIIKILVQSAPNLIPAFSKIYYFILRTQTSSEVKQVIAQVTGMSLNGVSLQGGKIAEQTFIEKHGKHMAITAFIGTVVGVGVWKKDEIMAAVTGKKLKSVNGLDGLDGTKKKGKKPTKGKKKVLGSTPNKGLKKMLAINKSAKALQKQSGYEMRNVKEVEVKIVRKSMPKLSWKEAQKRAKNLYR